MWVLGIEGRTCGHAASILTAELSLQNQDLFLLEEQ